MDLYKKYWNKFETVLAKKLQTTCIESEENNVIWHSSEQLYETFQMFQIFFCISNSRLVFKCVK